MPLPPGVRARRNKTTTRGTLRVLRGEEAATRQVPPLPPISVRNPDTGRSKRVAWHPRVRQWWTDLWQRSDYVDGLLEHEVSGGLYVLARLYQRFWAEGDAKAAQEIRLNEERLGLSPIARRRLQQEIDRGEQAAERTRRRHNERIHAAGTEDPRAVLDAESRLGPTPPTPGASR